MWKISDTIKTYSSQCFHDWEAVALQYFHNEILLRSIVRWVDTFLDDNDNIKWSCYELTLLFFLETYDELYDNFDYETLDEKVMEISDIICQLMSCNNYVESKIDWDKYKDVKNV